MHLTAAIVALVASSLAQATNVHNNWGHDAWIQDYAGTDLQLNNGNTVSIAGGWGFVWTASSVCADNSVAFTWPSDYGDVYIHNDGYLYGAGGDQLGNGAHLC